MKHVLLVLCLLLSTNALADSTGALDVGLGVFNSGKQSLSETKMASYTEQTSISDAFRLRATGGFWVDVTQGKSSSGFAAGQLGYEVNSKGTVLGAFTGPALITNTDVLLGGHFQFMDEFHLGLQDEGKSYIGVFYRHLSSAGLEMPNIGRDLVGIELRF